MKTPKFSEQEWKQIRAEERRYLRMIAAKNRSYQKAKAAGGPEVGIFWLAPNGKLLIDGTPVSEAASYGDLKIYEGTHTKLWDLYVRHSIVPTDVEYEEYPRGRVAFDTKTRQFWLFADACILKDKAIVNKIRNDFHLPSNTKTDKDPHYRCPKCLSKRTKKQKEDDWNF